MGIHVSRLLALHLSFFLGIYAFLVVRRNPGVGIAVGGHGLIYMWFLMWCSCVVYERNDVIFGVYSFSPPLPMWVGDGRVSIESLGGVLVFGRFPILSYCLE